MGCGRSSEVCCGVLNGSIGGGGGLNNNFPKLSQFWSASAGVLGVFWGCRNILGISEVLSLCNFVYFDLKFHNTFIFRSVIIDQLIIKFCFVKRQNIFFLIQTNSEFDVFFSFRKDGEICLPYSFDR